MTRISGLVMHAAQAHAAELEPIAFACSGRGRLAHARGADEQRMGLRPSGLSFRTARNSISALNFLEPIVILVKGLPPARFDRLGIDFRQGMASSQSR